MNIIQNDYSRQVNIFKPEEFKTPIHIIGAGATGSWVAFSLAKMGVENITIYDFDEVGMHNLPNQMFGIREIDRNKAFAIRNIIKQMTGISIKARNTKLEGGEPLQGIVFVLTDTMKSRKDIFNRSIKNNPNINLMIETRMDLRGGRIYVIDPKNREQIKQYEETLYSDEETEVSACGVSQTVLPSALAITSNAIWKMLNYINNEPFPNETILDFSNDIVFTTDFIKNDEEINEKWTKEKMLGKVFNCQTRKSSEKFAELCDNVGITWRTGEKVSNRTFWDNYENETCYEIDNKGTLSFSDIEYFEERNEEIIVFK